MTTATSPFLDRPLRTLEEAMLDLNVKTYDALPAATAKIMVDGEVRRVSGKVVAQTIEKEPEIDIRLDSDPKTVVRVKLAEAEIRQ